MSNEITVEALQSDVKILQELLQEVADKWWMSEKAWLALGLKRGDMSEEQYNSRYSMGTEEGVARRNGCQVRWIKDIEGKWTLETKAVLKTI